jgi:hypothetical protein
MLSPKLYGYPKVLVLAVACLLIVRYARAPAWWRVAVMSVWTAVAFLFRHDYVVYCGAGSVAVLLCAGPPSWGKRLGRTAVYGLLTVAILTPSLYWVERTEGLVTYLQNGVSMGRRDAARTAIAWPVPRIDATRGVIANLEREENSQAGLYYVLVLLAWLSPITAALRKRRGGDFRDDAILAVGVMAIPLSLFFLRGSLEARFGDMGPPAAVLGGWFVAIAVEGPRRSLWRRAATGSLACAVLVLAALSAWSLQSVRSELLRAGLLTSPAAVAWQASRVWLELGTMPESLRGPGVASPSGRAADYLNHCTTAHDRIMVVAYAPEVGGLSGRLFGGGRASFMPGFFEEERYSRFMMDRLIRESVPIVLAEDEPYYAAYPLLAPYLRDAYVERGRVEIDGGRTLRVLTKRGLAGRSYGPAMLPCFGAEGTGDGLSQLR